MSVHQDITLPDFDKWTKRVYLSSGGSSTDINPLHLEIIKHSLLSAYSKGYTLGLNKGWAIEQDKDYTNE